MSQLRLTAALYSVSMGTSRGKIWFVPSQSQHSVTCPSLLPRPHIGGGLHSLATTVLLTECSIAYSIGLLPILHIVPSNRMPSHIRHVSQPPSSIWIIAAAPFSSSQHNTAQQLHAVSNGHVGQPPCLPTVSPHHRISHKRRWHPSPPGGAAAHLTPPSP